MALLRIPVLTARGNSQVFLCSSDIYTNSTVKYIGQAAYISDEPEAFSNPFFSSVPPGMFYPSLVMAILAAIVASQTMITATFQVRLDDFS